MDMDDERAKAATKGDLIELEAKFDGKLSQLKDDLVEAIRDSQTEVLRAFYGFSQTVLDRFKEQDQTEAGLKRRMATIESRIFEIEKRLNMPPSGI
jgi:hypothetical protein